MIRTQDYETFYRTLRQRGLAASHLLAQARREPGAQLQAYVNHGRWIADCPHCSGAEIVTRDGLFMCCSCIAAGEAPRFYQIAFPKERQQIELILETRPIRNRNWKAGESIEALRAENALMLGRRA